MGLVDDGKQMTRIVEYEVRRSGESVISDLIRDLYVLAGVKNSAPGQSIYGIPGDVVMDICVRICRIFAL